MQPLVLLSLEHHNVNLGHLLKSKNIKLESMYYSSFKETLKTPLSLTKLFKQILLNIWISFTSEELFLWSMYEFEVIILRLWGVLCVLCVYKIKSLIGQLLFNYKIITPRSIIIKPVITHSTLFILSIKYSTF